jgi:hypothetical protein
MIPQNITREHILQAIQEITSSKIPVHRESSNYDLFFERKRFPPKYVISIANKYANGRELLASEFDAVDAKTFLPKLGFEIKLKFDIKPGDVIANQQISTLFGVGTQGGMRKSNKTNTLVIISDQTKPYYKDEWKGDIFHYTGMGITGDQDVNYAQNKTLAESNTNGVEVHLFEVFSQNKYTYQGIVELAGNPYEKIQKDKDGNERKVVIFPLKLKQTYQKISDSIIIAGMGWSSKRWQGFEEHDIQLDYIPREAWNFFDFDDTSYYGFISEKMPAKFKNGGLVLLTSTEPITKNRFLVGFYGNVVFDNIISPVDISDTIPDEQIRQQFKQKFSGSPYLTLRNLKADKTLSTCFLSPVEFDLNELDIKNWRQAAFMYIGDNERISKEKTQQLIQKALIIHQNLLIKATGEEKEKIATDIDKIQKILDLYFTDSGGIHYWAVLPSSLKPTGNKTEMWPIWTQKQIVSISWKDLVEKYGEKLLNYSSYDEFVSEYREVYPETQADMVWKFIYEMKEGDIVLANRGHDTIFGRGVIKSPPKILKNESLEPSDDIDLLSDWPIYREVIWGEVVPEIAIPSELKGKFSRRVIELTKDEYEKIFGLSAGSPQSSVKKYEKKQIILYGPPGTGKTYNSVIKAHEIIFGYSDPNITYKLLHEKLKSRQQNEINISHLSWLEAITLAFEEIKKEKVQVDEIKKSKIIQDFSSYKNNHSISNTIWYILQAESKLDSDNVKSKNKSGREYFDKDTESNWYLTEKGKDYQKLLIEDLNDFPETSDSQFSFITFHQSFSYEDFVEGIRPELNRSDESIIEYRIKDGIFKEICKKAAKDPDNNYVLIIDEINRGNISKIFGELITLLEDNKRTGEKEEITVKLPYSNDSFSVPNNVYIIGTMNSTDKSIALVDIALRRRFHFERINVDYELIRNKDAKLFLTQLNSIICAIKNPDYEIGHYYFMNVPETDHENQELKKVFSNQILPLLEEYFFNDWEALATILGRDSIKIEKRKKFVWDEDSGKFEEDGGDYDQIYGRCLKSSEIVFENTMRNLGIRKNDQEIKQ